MLECCYGECFFNPSGDFNSASYQAHGGIENSNKSDEKRRKRKIIYKATISSLERLFSSSAGSAANHV